MLSAIFNIMWLRLWRDKGALILAFVLPGLVFAIFAAIFSNASGGDLDLRASLAVTDQSPVTQNFADAFKNSDALSVSYKPEWTLPDIQERVRLGQDDAGVILAGNLADPSAPSVIIVSEPSRENIGATAILFLLFSAMQGASLSLDERKSGISDRFLVGPMGALKLLTGKFTFLTFIGFIQAAIIIAVAHVFFNVPIQNHLLGLSLACFGMAALASGIALLTASLCGSVTQMHTVSTFVVLLFSAIGGSMVPRFMMPDWLQGLGQFTPNAYAIDSVYGILARGQSISDLVNVWGVLFGGAAIAVILAAILSHVLKRV